jgi:hypothetical protein
MDMQKHLRRWLNDAELRRLDDGRYEGRIERVVEEPIRNRFTATKQLEPVIYFEDGLRLIPNIGMRRALIEFWGPNTENWIGRPLVVFRASITDPQTGKTRWEKRVMRPASDDRAHRRVLRAVNDQ